MSTALRRKVMVIHRRLLKAFGEPALPAHRGDALGELIACILSQHTSDVNSGRAFAALRARFPDWAQVRDAPPSAVVAAIRSAGLANQKGPRIQGVLRAVSRERGALDINFLADWPIPDAKAWLQRLHGVGPKTAAITLLFGLGRPAFPVDTHVHRVAGRLGLIPLRMPAGATPQVLRTAVRAAGHRLPAGATPQVLRTAVRAAGRCLPADRAHDALEAIVPRRLYFPFHMNLIRHGRTVCQARLPKCMVCPLTDLCEYYAAHPVKRVINRFEHIGKL
jgi:endonuclease III